MNKYLNGFSICLYIIFTSIPNFGYTGIDDDYQYIAVNVCFGGFSVCDETINYLKNKYPNEKFPDGEFDYKSEEIRLNQKFCKEIIDNPGKFRGYGTRLGVEKISKLALRFPGCWSIQEYDGAEGVYIDEEKLRLMNIMEKISSLNKNVRDLIYSSEYTDKVKISYLQYIFIPDDSDQEPPTKNRKLDLNSTVKQSYTEKIITNLPFAPTLDEFKKPGESLN